MARIIRRKTVPPVREVTDSKFDLIIGADLHLREDTPICRTDDYQEAQYNKATFIRHLCERNGCPFLVAGDVFNHWKPSPYLLSQCLGSLPKKIICVPGQHDLPQHNLLEYAKTGLNTLQQAGRVYALTQGRSSILGDSRPCPGVIYGYGYGEIAHDAPKAVARGRAILVIHDLICNTTQPWPGAGATPARRLLSAFPSYDLIVSGDNHQQFVVALNDGRTLINPGSMMRMTADQADFEPAVFGWRAIDNSVTRLPLPLVTEVLSREHLPEEDKQSRDARMTAYIARAAKQFEAGLHFEGNLRAFFRSHKEPKPVERLVWRAMEKETR